MADHEVRKVALEWFHSDHFGHSAADGTTEYYMNRQNYCMQSFVLVRALQRQNDEPTGEVQGRIGRQWEQVERRAQKSALGFDEAFAWLFGMVEMWAEVATADAYCALFRTFRQAVDAAAAAAADAAMVAAIAADQARSAAAGETTVGSAQLLKQARVRAKTLKSGALTRAATAIRRRLDLDVTDAVCAACSAAQAAGRAAAAAAYRANAYCEVRNWIEDGTRAPAARTAARRAAAAAQGAVAAIRINLKVPMAAVAAAQRVADSQAAEARQKKLAAAQGKSAAADAAAVAAQVAAAAAAATTQCAQAAEEAVGAAVSTRKAMRQRQLRGQADYDHARAQRSTASNQMEFWIRSAKARVIQSARKVGKPDDSMAATSLSFVESDDDDDDDDDGTRSVKPVVALRCIVCAFHQLVQRWSPDTGALKPLKPESGSFGSQSARSPRARGHQSRSPSPYPPQSPSPFQLSPSPIPLRKLQGAKPVFEIPVELAWFRVCRCKTDPSVVSDEAARAVAKMERSLSGDGEHYTWEQPVPNDDHSILEVCATRVKPDVMTVVQRRKQTCQPRKHRAPADLGRETFLQGGGVRAGVAVGEYPFAAGKRTNPFVRNLAVLQSDEADSRRCRSRVLLPFGNSAVIQRAGKKLRHHVMAEHSPPHYNSDYQAVGVEPVLSDAGQYLEERNCAPQSGKFWLQPHQQPLVSPNPAREPDYQVIDQTARLQMERQVLLGLCADSLGIDENRDWSVEGEPVVHHDSLVRAFEPRRPQSLVAKRSDSSPRRKKSNSTVGSRAGSRLGNQNATAPPPMHMLAGVVAPPPEEAAPFNRPPMGRFTCPVPRARGADAGVPQYTPVPRNFTSTPDMHQATPGTEHEQRLALPQAGTPTRSRPGSRMRTPKTAPRPQQRPARHDRDPGNGGLSVSPGPVFVFAARPDGRVLEQPCEPLGTYGVARSARAGALQPEQGAGTDSLQQDCRADWMFAMSSC